VVGAGGLGSSSLYYIAASGVGKIRLIDSDSPDLTNLQRQILYTPEDIGRPKAETAERILKKFNPFVEIESISERLGLKNSEKFFKGADLVLEGSDNFETKFFVTDACHFYNIPYIIAGVLRFEAQIISVIPKETACYRCIFHSPPPPDAVPNCSDAGVIGALAGTIGSMQALIAIQYLVGMKESFGKLVSFESREFEMRKIIMKKNSKCPLCGENPEITELREIESYLAC
jgi:adenylyltransferase/sulfurtransferase